MIWWAVLEFSRGENRKTIDGAVCPWPKEGISNGLIAGKYFWPTFIWLTRTEVILISLYKYIYRGRGFLWVSWGACSLSEVFTVKAPLMGIGMRVTCRRCYRLKSHKVPREKMIGQEQKRKKNNKIEREWLRELWVKKKILLFISTKVSKLNLYFGNIFRKTKPIFS